MRKSHQNVQNGNPDTDKGRESVILNVSKFPLRYVLNNEEIDALQKFDNLYTGSASTLQPLTVQHASSSPYSPALTFNDLMTSVNKKFSPGRKTESVSMEHKAKTNGSSMSCDAVVLYKNDQSSSAFLKEKDEVHTQTATVPGLY